MRTRVFYLHCDLSQSLSSARVRQLQVNQPTIPCVILTDLFSHSWKWSGSGRGKPPPISIHRIEDSIQCQVADLGLFGCGGVVPAPGNCIFDGKTPVTSSCTMYVRFNRTLLDRKLHACLMHLHHAIGETANKNVETNYRNKMKSLRM